MTHLPYTYKCACLLVTLSNYPVMAHISFYKGKSERCDGAANSRDIYVFAFVSLFEGLSKRAPAVF